MMLVNVTVAKSPIHGNGLFALEPIKAGDKVYCFCPGMDDFVLLKKASRSEKHFGYVNAISPHILHICGDSAKWWNFPKEGDKANCISSCLILYGDNVIVAARDIAAGEELTIEPASDLDYHRKLGLTPSN